MDIFLLVCSVGVVYVASHQSFDDALEFVLVLPAEFLAPRGDGVVQYGNDGFPDLVSNAAVLPARNVQLQHYGQRECLSNGLIEPHETVRSELEQFVYVVVVHAQGLDDSGDGATIDLLEFSVQNFGRELLVKEFVCEGLFDVTLLCLDKVDQALCLGADGDREFLHPLPLVE
jgi:hypothetical protein